MTDEQILQAIKAIQQDTLAQIDQKLEMQSKNLLEEFNVVIEDKVSHEIKIIAEGHSDIMQRLPNVNEMEELKSRVRVLERIIKEHSRSIDSFSKAQ